MKKNDEQLGPINYEEFDEYLNSTVFIVREICYNKETHTDCLTKLYNFMKQGFEIKEVRSHPLMFKFENKDDEPIKTMQIRHFIINLILWYAFIVYEAQDKLDESKIFDCSDPTLKNLYSFMNRKIIIPYEKIIDSKVINRVLDKIIYKLSRIYYDFALIMGLTMDMRSFNDLRNKFPQFDELLRTKPEKGMQPKEIEEMIDTKMQEYLDLVLVRDKTNNLRPFLISGKGINKDQLSQLSIMGGLKPDIEGNVNPVPIDSNFIYGGLNSITNFYIDGQAGCKPLILNKTVMGKSGYFSYKTMTLSSLYRLSTTIKDCHSKRPIKFEVKSKKHLEKIDRRYYVDDKGELQLINATKDDFLIGQTILLRDPTTCCAADGICPICYGDMHYINNDPYFHAGRFAATQINDPIQQNILSSKHMLKTISKLIEFTNSKDFSRFFKVDINKITINENSNENFKNWRMIIEEDDLFIIDEVSGEGEDFNMYAEKFTLHNKKTGEKIVIQESNKRDLYLFATISSMLKKDGDQYILPLDKVTEDDSIMKINIVNNELTTPLKNIIKLLDRKEHFGCVTIDDMINRICELTIESGMSVDTVHCSMLIKGLIRSRDNILLPPDFSDPDEVENYQILRVTDALIYNPSLTISLSYDNINNQIVNPVTYRKYCKSDYDKFFKEDIMDDVKEYYDKKKEEKKQKKLNKLIKEYEKNHEIK